MNDLSYFRDARVLITGGAGMIGSTIARLLVEQGAEVTVADAMLPAYGGNRFNLTDILDKIVFVKGDIRDLDRVRQWVDGADYVFSLAAQVSYVDSNHDPLLDLDINCRGHLNLLLALSQVNRRAKVVFTSSRFVYGSIDYNPVDEGHGFNCLSIYGIHKLAGEKYYRFYHDAHGLDTVSLRLTNPYGPRQQMKHSKYGIVNWFIRLALEGQAPDGLRGRPAKTGLYFRGRRGRRDCERRPEPPAPPARSIISGRERARRSSTWCAWWPRPSRAPRCSTCPGPRTAILWKPAILWRISAKSKRPQAGLPASAWRRAFGKPWIFIGSIGNITGEAIL
jgi:dTDP-4-dehydrorhamnose reductase